VRGGLGNRKEFEFAPQALIRSL
jgi:hypothetical protein